MRVRRTARGIATLCAIGLIAGGAGLAGPARAGPVGHHRAAGCAPRTLVLSAMPVELSPLLIQEKVIIDDHAFYKGRLVGHRVILALTGIGPVNATHVTHEAIRHFRCANGRKAIRAIVFSGVAGGDFIGNVNVPTRWTKNAGKHFYGVSHRMLRAVRRIHHLKLEQKTPAGDPLCGCVTKPGAVKTVSVTHKPKLEIGGKGQTTDPFSGEALPCVPGAGDVFGCDPCPVKKRLSEESSKSAKGLAKFAKPSFLTGYFAASASESGNYVSEDEETAAVDAVAHHHHVPFLGFRAVSDGGGDPLGLPGFPAEFFYYRQISADNAALTTLAFLKRWHRH
jgi:nucleoside phosphorylase